LARLHSAFGAPLPNGLEMQIALRALLNMRRNPATSETPRLPTPPLFNKLER